MGLSEKALPTVRVLAFMTCNNRDRGRSPDYLSDWSPGSQRHQLDGCRPSTLRFRYRTYRHRRASARGPEVHRSGPAARMTSACEQ